MMVFFLLFLHLRNGRINNLKRKKNVRKCGKLSSLEFCPSHIACREPQCFCTKKKKNYKITSIWKIAASRRNVSSTACVHVNNYTRRARCMPSRMLEKAREEEEGKTVQHTGTEKEATSFSLFSFIISRARNFYSVHYRLWMSSSV